jgi:2-amino-4-hydroxy-6-hydroxymethyldihydropteridine diphosphokinase
VKFSSRPLDIDLLLYGEQVISEPPVHVPRSDVLEYGFVLRPLAELAPELVHPQTGQTLSSHWQQFDVGRHPLQLVEISL